VEFTVGRSEDLKTRYKESMVEEWWAKKTKGRGNCIIQVLFGICLEEPKLLLQQPTRLCDYRIYSYNPQTSMVLHLYSSYQV